MTEWELLKIPPPSTTAATTHPLGMSSQILIDDDNTFLSRDQLLFSASS